MYFKGFNNTIRLLITIYQDKTQNICIKFT